VSYQFRDVRRGEVIVFAGDEPFGADLDTTTGERVLIGVGQFLGVVPVDAQDFVKRVIGLPGDTVEIVDGVVSVNGVELDEPYAIADSSAGVWEVPDGSLFVMGDNRPNSGDSRTSLGFIARDEVVGRAIARIWPLDRIGSVEGVDWAPIPEPG
jgi:signal peptidase I